MFKKYLSLENPKDKIFRCSRINKTKYSVRLLKITLGRYKNDNNNLMIQLTDVFGALFMCDWISNFYLQ